MFLAGILERARKGGENLVNREDPVPENSFERQLTADEEAMAANILSMIQKNQKHDDDLAQQEEEQIFESEMPKDINGNENDTGEAVHWRPHTSHITMVPGIPYAVCDFDHICNQCTRYKSCERHRKPHCVKTDISLCKANHLRMAVDWDITDPENRKGTWVFGINEQYDRLDDPERQREEHAIYVKRKAKGASDKIQHKGCRPIEPKWRVKELAARMTEDYNKEQEKKARVGNLDLKGREYYTRRKDWGPQEPFKPSEVGDTRAAREYKTSLDNARIELELRVLLQAWYRSKSRKDERVVDRMSLNANAVWREKMVALEAARPTEAAETTETAVATEAASSTGAARAAEGSSEPLEPSDSREGTSRTTATLSSSTRVETMKARAERLERHKSTTTNEQMYIRIAEKKVALEEKQKKKKKGKAARAPAAEAKRDTKKAARERKAVADDSSESEPENSVTKTQVVENSEIAESVPASDEELSPEQIAIFEQMAADAEDEASGKNKKPVEKSASFHTPKLQARACDFTAEERKILQDIKQKEDEVVHSEDEPESEPEPEVEEEEEEEVQEEVEEPKQKTSKLQKVAEVSPLASTKKPLPKQLKDEQPAPKTAKSKTEKRKASSSPSSSDPPAKKSKKEKAPPKQKTPKPKKEPAAPKPPKPKRKSSSPPDDDEPLAKKTRKTYKSTATILDSDEEANYGLPAAPALELPEQREGWKFTEALSEEIEESVKIVQTDKKKKLSGAEGVVVEQGTTIVKRVESEKCSLPKPRIEVKKVDEAEEEVEADLPPAPRSSAKVSSALKKRKASFTGEEKPAKKAKKASFEDAVFGHVERKRKMSIEYVVNGDDDAVDEQEDHIDDGGCEKVADKTEVNVNEVVETIEVDEDEPQAEEDDEDYDDLFEG